MFEIGDVVMLASGGPRMTVADANGDYIDAVWFASDGHLLRHSFDRRVLVSSDRPSEKEDEKGWTHDVLDAIEFDANGDWLTVAEWCALEGISTNRFYQLRKSGRIPEAAWRKRDGRVEVSAEFRRPSADNKARLRRCVDRLSEFPGDRKSADALYAALVLEIGQPELERRCGVVVADGITTTAAENQAIKVAREVLER